MNNQFPTLTTSRLLLDEVTLVDTAEIYEIFSDSKVIKYYDFEQFTDLKQAVELIEQDQKKYNNGSHLRWAVREKTSLKLIGSIGIKWNNDNHSATLGYEFNQSTWGKGFATEALKQVINYLLIIEEVKKINRLEAFTMQGNHASEKVLLKLGFKSEGLLRGYGYWKQQYHDLNIFSRLRSH
ncbi:GNAT family N-acetyltransferase [Pseudoalteromonas denitrificans]|uniref:Ribosomal-protein-alanine N-acetyltransferase n=1 Tax=Pseudoalteromonas denitrificans DSM 6059 TaxID=1123010 RepID=A0A1I1KJQ3_9GAMM|nr:GNAT family protein [Pseudoalteromonas denitrificans]SFC61204.1 ribosomal-protein-alanine N-acetyltransferase [Pseudoalteromonas denitrificans DSM 6059]